jgi:Zn-dependent peptidase ImmA (M78 family)
MARADVAAWQLLEDLGIAEPPVRPDEVAQSRGAVVLYQRMAMDVSGVLLREGSQRVIGVNKDHAAVRQRFTIAHELGHLELHRGRPLILDTAVRINFRDTVSGLATDREEVEANRFAAALLMPERMIMQQFGGAPVGDPDDLIAHLARRFHVSVAAMTNRLANLSLIVPG